MTQTMLASNPKQRFTNRVEDYVRYRPSYPRAILEVLREECGLTSESVIVDVGSGTGILAKLFLDNGNVVYGVEPNAAMREAGERWLQDQARFHSVTGSAEATTLPNASANFITAGQAFHWFEVQAARTEFGRVLKPGGWVAVVWNERNKVATAFLRAYEELLRAYGTDYAQVIQQYPGKPQMESFFGKGAFREGVFPNEQVLDFEGLRGRLLSSSYAPAKDNSKHEPMLAELRRIFDAHAERGFVRIEYRTRLYYGHLPGGERGDSSGR